MAASTRQESAKIYIFPVRRVSSLALKRDDARGMPGETQPLAPVDVDAWYHQAAIQDVPPPRKG